MEVDFSGRGLTLSLAVEDWSDKGSPPQPAAVGDLTPLELRETDKVRVDFADTIQDVAWNEASNLLAVAAALPGLPNQIVILDALDPGKCFSAIAATGNLTGGSAGGRMLSVAFKKLILTNTFDPSKNAIFAAGSTDNKLYVFAFSQAEGNPVLVSSKDLGQDVKAVAYNPFYIAAGTNANNVNVFTFDLFGLTEIDNATSSLGVDFGGENIRSVDWCPRSDPGPRNAFVRDMLADDNGFLLATAGDDSRVRIFEVGSDGRFKSLLAEGTGARFDGQRVTSVSFSPDCRLLAAGSHNANVVVHHIERIIATWVLKIAFDSNDLSPRPFQRQVREVSWASDGRFLAAAGSDIENRGKLVLFNINLESGGFEGIQEPVLSGVGVFEGRGNGSSDNDQNTVAVSPNNYWVSTGGDNDIQWNFPLSPTADGCLRVVDGKVIQ